MRRRGLSDPAYIAHRQTEVAVDAAMIEAGGSVERWGRENVRNHTEWDVPWGRQ